MWLIFFYIGINQKKTKNVGYDLCVYSTCIHRELRNITARVVCVCVYTFLWLFFFIIIIRLYVCVCVRVFARPAKVFTNTELQLCRFTHLFVKHELNGYVGQHFPKSFYGYFYLAGMVKCSGVPISQPPRTPGLYKLIITLLSNFIRLQHTHCSHICDSTNHFRLAVLKHSF